ncbi:MAG: hypothetical protein FJ146_06945 [Deltaproteobacteria bacterium]|nr:hypothetical protein [Deltaproteobacteria bacterium]
MKFRSLCLRTLLVLTLASCVESNSEESTNTTKKTESENGKNKPAWWQSNTMATGTVNGSGSVAAPVSAPVTVAVPNYGGAPSNLISLVDTVVAQLPPQQRNATVASGAQGFGQGGGVFGGGLLAGFGNLLMGLLGLK